MLSDDPLTPDDTKSFEGSIPTVVYNNTVRAIPNNVSLRTKCLDVFKLFRDTDRVKNILQNIDRDFGEKPWSVDCSNKIYTLKDEFIL